MQLWTFASGSSGNCFLVESEGTHLLVECGRPLRDVLRYLEHAGVDPRDVHGAVLTHAHGDHSASARAFSDAYQVPIYASQGTLGCASLRGSSLGRVVSAGTPVAVGEILIRPFAVPHDCYEPLGYRFESHTGRVGVATDLGWVPDTARQQFEGLDVLVLEANYDPHLLHTGRYPAFLKHRVAGYRGHLSNHDTGNALAACGDRAPRAVWLAHISERNNTPRHALRTVGEILRTRGLGHTPLLATQHRRPSLYWNSTPPAQQLSLW